MPENARLPRNIQGSLTRCKSTTWDRRLYFTSEGRRADDFFALKNPTALAGFEPANLGTKGQHATSRPPKPLLTGSFILLKHNSLLKIHLDVGVELSMAMGSRLTGAGQLLLLTLLQTAIINFRNWPSLTNRSFASCSQWGFEP